jgi:hypothetical protein
MRGKKRDYSSVSGSRAPASNKVARTDSRTTPRTRALEEEQEQHTKSIQPTLQVKLQQQGQHQQQIKVEAGQATQPTPKVDQVVHTVQVREAVSKDYRSQAALSKHLLAAKSMTEEEEERELSYIATSYLHACPKKQRGEVSCVSYLSPSPPSSTLFPHPSSAYPFPETPH